MQEIDRFSGTNEEACFDLPRIWFFSFFFWERRSDVIQQMVARCITFVSDQLLPSV